jgi:hypothetical protein
MITTQTIYCPNCGDRAEKFRCSETKILRTSCHHCDYLLVQCSETGKVIEAYAPGINFTMLQNEMPAIARKQHLLLNHENSAQ